MTDFLRYVAVVLVLLPLMAAGQPSNSSQANFSAQVASGSAELRATVDLSALPQSSAADRAIPGRFANLGPQTGLTDAQFRSLKQQAASLRVANLAPTQTSPPQSDVGMYTPGVTKNFAGIDLTCASVIPADMGVAVGGSYVVQVVNDCITVLNKTTGVPYAGFPKTTNAFFGLPPNNFNTGQFMTDPRAFYDTVANRFVIAMLWEDLPNSRGFLMLAASATSNPTGSWRLYMVQVASAGTCPDFPTLGHNRYKDKYVGAIAISFNLFACNPSGFGGFTNNLIWFFPKTNVYAGSGFGFNGFVSFTYGGLLLDTLQPINVSNKDDNPRAIFAVNTFNIKFGGGQCINGCNGLVVWAFSNVLQNSGSPGPVWSGVVIPTPSNYFLPPDATQPGGANSIATNDVRISGAVQYDMGDMFATATTNGGAGHPAILAWKFHATLNDNGGGCAGAFLNACPTITSATVDQELPYDVGASSFGAYFGTVQPDRAGSFTMVFNFSGTGHFGSTAYATNRVTQAPNAWHDSGSFLAIGGAFYPYYRWGDYTGTSVELLSPNVFWFSGMYTLNNGLWGTRIGKNGYTASNQP